MKDSASDSGDIRGIGGMRGSGSDGLIGNEPGIRCGIPDISDGMSGGRGTSGIRRSSVMRVVATT